MRQIAISVLSMFIVLPALADVRLPVVNLAAGGVSARAAFGETVPQKSNSQEQGKNVNIVSGVSKNISSENKSYKDSSSRNVVARSASANKSKVIDSGEQIVASDVLSPRRPSSDLWARTSSDVIPLRLPSPQEFSVIRSDAPLPEESLNVGSERVVSARSGNKTSNVAEKTKVVEPLSEIDAQIARLNELQRRADESINDEPVAYVRNTQVNQVAERNATSGAKFSEKTDVEKNEKEDITLSKMVVPMDDVVDDVVVRTVQSVESPRIVSARDEMTQMSPSELRKAFRKTFLSENKHLSTFQIDDRFDVASDMTINAEGFTSERDLSESGGIRPLEIKIKFRNDDSALSRDNYNLLTEYAGIVLSNPTRAVQVSIPQSVTTNSDERKLAARRLAIIEQVLRDNGISEQRILPVLSQRDEEGLVLRMISLDQYETLTKQQKDIFGDTVSKKTYRSMSW